MIDFIRYSLLCLAPEERRWYFIVMAVAILSAALELVGIAAIVPVLHTLLIPEKIDAYNLWIQGRYNYNLELTNLKIAFFSASLVMVSGLVTFLDKYLRMKFLRVVIAKVSVRVYKNFLSNGLDEFYLRSEAEFVTATEKVGGILVDQVLLGLVQIVSRISLLVIVITILAFVNLVVTGLIVGVLLFVYLIIYKYVKGYIKSCNQRNLVARKRLHVIKVQSYRDFRQLKYKEARRNVLGLYSRLRSKIADLESNVSIVGSSPKIILETVGLICLIVSAYYIAHTSGAEFFISNLAIFAVSAYRLLPALQQSYHAVNRLVAAMSLQELVFDAFSADLELSDDQPTLVSDHLPDTFKNISVKALAYRYPNSDFFTISNLNFDVDLTGTTLLVGDSGVGKSTLLDILLGFRQPTSGSVYVDKLDLSDVHVAWQESTALVSQGTKFIGNNLLEIVVGAGAGVVSDAELSKAFKTTGLVDFIDRGELNLDSSLEHINSMSGGERSRIAIATALCSGRQVVFMDEPFSSLDIDSARLISRKMSENYVDRAFVIITHRMREVSRVDHVIKI